ncbi:MAG: hypothetical protein IPM51_13300 [Sphingobacteriaceae bacterium]|nr:hypothetical protein [Sphingobacteriaceae bacterium]
MNTKLSYLLLVVAFYSCKKNKLKNEYAAFIGNYTWSYTMLNDNNIFSNTSTSLTPNTTGYSVTFELNDKGEAIFMKNGTVLTKNKYSITEKESYSPGNAKITIKLKRKTGELNISKDNLTLRLSGDTLLGIDEFPFPAIDKVDNYKSGYSQNENKFIKQ